MTYTYTEAANCQYFESSGVDRISLYDKRFMFIA